MMKPRVYAWLGIGAVLLVAGVALFSSRLMSRAPDIDPGNPAQVALGRAIYAERCAMCHGANLEGQPDWMTRKPNGRLPAPPHDVSGHTWHHPDQQLMLITKRGLSAVVPGYESDMPAFESVLTDDEIAAVLAFIKTSWPADIQERQRAMSRASGQ
jgi:mono/diheme cytochrome c family protein